MFSKKPPQKYCLLSFGPFLSTSPLRLGGDSYSIRLWSSVSTFMGKLVWRFTCESQQGLVCNWLQMRN